MSQLRLTSRSVLSASGLSAARLSKAHAVTPYLRQFILPTLSPSPFYSRQLSTSPARWSPSKEGSDSKALAKEPTPKGTRLQRIWVSIKKEASHYWHGTKLLGKEIRISARIQGRLLAGKKLTRREHRQASRKPRPGPGPITHLFPCCS